MSQENVDVVRDLYRAMNTQDADAIRQLAHPDVEWIPDRSRVADAPARGVEDVIRFFTERAEVFGELHAEPERFWDADDKVLVFLHVTGEGRASHATFDIHIAHLWTLEDGIVVRGQGFGDRDAAREAARVAE